MAQKSICLVEDCDNHSVNGRGYCSAHYRRLLRHGSPTGGGPRRGEIQKWIFDHVAFDLDDCLIWPYATTSDGYACVHVGGTVTTATRIMCEKAHGPAPTRLHVAAHSCGNGSSGCMNQKHLRWATTEDNHADKKLHGTHLIGSRNGAAKLSEDQVISIRSLYGTASQASIGKMFGVSAGAVRRIHLGIDWGWLKSA